MNHVLVTYVKQKILSTKCSALCSAPTVGPICYTEEMFLYILFIDCICVLIKDVYKYLNMFVLRSYMRFKNATMEDENLLFQE